jgi:hypothetical protein
MGANIGFHNIMLERVRNANSWGCIVGCESADDVYIKLSRYQQFRVTMKRTLVRKCQEEALLELYRVIITSTLLYDPNGES